MKIFLSNDDGIKARGLLQLALKLSTLHEVTVYAPVDEQSCRSHAINFFSPIPVKSYSCEELFAFSEFSGNDGILSQKSKELIQNMHFFHVNGTPCDAVKLGLALEVSKGNTPDLVISGINNRMNLGTDCLYSGTVNGALEGAISRIKSIAVSIDAHDNDYEFATEFVLKNVCNFYKLLPDSETILNVNIPYTKREKIRGVATTTTGNRIFEDEYQYINGKGYMVTGHPISIPNDHMADIIKTAEGYIAIAPVKVSFSDYNLFEKIKDAQFDF